MSFLFMFEIMSFSQNLRTNNDKTWYDEISIAIEFHEIWELT